MTPRAPGAGVRSAGIAGAVAVTTGVVTSVVGAPRTRVTPRVVRALNLTVGLAIAAFGLLAISACLQA